MDRERLSTVADNKVSAIPLSKVVLYKHGIGYFERRGKVTGPTSINLVCEADEIDDMLKSIVALADNTKIDAITYDSSKTLASRLAEFGFDISNSIGLSGLLAQMKGIPVTISTSGELISGRVLGLDVSEQIIKEQIVREEQISLYTADSSFKRIGISSISKITIDDESMAEELKQQLELLFQNAKKKDRKALSVVLSSPDEHNVFIAYSIPCPIWKTSYRLVLNEDASLLLQGMAIVDNLQEEDWTNVQLVLVSASPISFIQPLYDPVKPFRPRIKAQGINSAGPAVAERATRPKMPQMPMTGAMRGGAASPAAAQQQQAYAFDAVDAWGAAAQSAPSAAMAQMSGMMSEAFEEALTVDAADTGECFEYRIGKPITVPRNSSALVPIVQEQIEGKRISLYNESKNSKFPHAAIWLTNTTKLTLEAGPVTVVEGDIYAGEALLDTTKPGDSRFLLFAIDQSCPITTRTTQTARPLWRVRSLNCVLYFDYRVRSQKTYEIENLSDKKKIVYIEHPLRSGWKVESEQKPTEITQNFYRFSQDVEPKSSAYLVLNEESDSVEHISIFDPNRLDNTKINWLFSQNFVDGDDFISFLKTIRELQPAIMMKSNELGAKQSILKQFEADQARARENLQSLGANNERYRKLIDEAEDRINQTNREIQTLQAELRDLVQRYQGLASSSFSAELKIPV
jgi:hypothetical protein